MIPFLSFDYQDALYRKELIDAMTEVLDSKWYIMGNRLQKFEENYAKFNDTQFALGVANGLDAITIALKVLGIKEGDEVIVPSNTYIATWIAASSLGAIPIPVEPDERTYNINPKLIEAAITEKTKAIIPVHLYGQACNMTEILEIAKKHNLFVVEDNAQAHLATWENKITGSFGDINATSFYPGKNLGALGDAGAITTNSEDLFKDARTYRNYGSNIKYHNEVIGVNSRLDELQAAVLDVKLPFLKELTDQRIAAAHHYNELLKDIPEVTIPFCEEKATHVYHVYAILIKDRDQLQKYLGEKQIGTLIHYPIPAHLQKAYAHLNYKQGDYPIAERIAKEILSLPMFPGITNEQIEYVCNSIKEYYAR